MLRFPFVALGKAIRQNTYIFLKISKFINEINFFGFLVPYTAKYLWKHRRGTLNVIISKINHE